MKVSLVVATLVITSAVPAVADYYVALRIGSGGCEIMTTPPTDTKKYKMMGTYSSEDEAKKAIAYGRRCYTASKAH